MSFRRIMLVVLPVLGAIFVFMCIRWVYRDWEGSLQPPPHNPAADKPDMAGGMEKMRLQDKWWHEESENVNLTQQDKTGRPTMHFMADRIIHASGKSWDVTRPRVQFFTRAGEIINLAGDQGRVISSGGNPTSIDQVESGVLWGHVVMSHDRGTPDDTSDDIMVTLDEIAFNNDTFELSTDGPVVLVSMDMQMTARKMRVALDRQTRRLSTMTFLEDIRLSMDVGDKTQLMASPTAPSPPAQTPTAVPPAKAGAAADDRSELWRIDLVGNVDARQADQKITCQHLSLFNRSSRGTTSPATGGQAKSKASTAPPRKTGDRPPRGQLVVIADGPLMITPVAPAERLAMGDKQFQVAATGAPVTVDDGQTKVVGGEVYYNTQSGSGTVIGKDGPILVEQPGRLRLTGNRLDFDRLIRPGHELPTADVQGAGTLLAQVQTAEVVPSGRPRRAAVEPAGAPPAAPPETSQLDATWTRGMHLEFYQMPTTTATGTAATSGEVRTSVFHGQAVVKQRDGVLKGDELAIDFFRAEAGKSQAIERLRGQGNVYIKNQPPAGDAVKPTTSSSVGDIACQKMDMTFRRDATGEAQPSHLEASGGVVIHEAPAAAAPGAPAAPPAAGPQKPAITAEELVIDFGPDGKGGVEPRFFEATGKALVNRADLYAEGDHIRRDMAAGTMLLEGKPAKAARGTTRIQGPRIEFNQGDGIATVRGAGELEMLSSTDLRGTRRKAPEPMLVRWQKSMLYEDARNFAQFDGGAMAATSGNRLDCDRLWVYFADRPKPAAGAPGATVAAGATGGLPASAPTVTSGATAGLPAGAPTGTAPAKAPKARPGDDMGQLFGNKDSSKDIVRVFAEKNVRAIEQQLEPDGTLKYQMEIGGDNLTYVAETRNTYIRSPGRVRILSHEKPAADQTPTPGIAPETAPTFVKGPLPPGYSRTEVAWADTMAYDGASGQAYFKGNVDALYAGRKGPANAAARGKSSDMRVQANEVQAVFSQKATATGTAGAAPAATSTAAAPTPASSAAQAPEDRMNVEKFVANGNVRLAIDNRRGTSDRLIYQRVPEIVRLYRGADDWARLWEEDESKQEYDEVVARTIAYEPGTGRIEMQDQQTMTVAPKAVVPKKAAATP